MADEQVNAKKDVVSGDAVLDLLDTVNELYAARGKKVVHFNLKKERPSDEELKKLILGPTGNLRAPTLRRGKTLVVGFHQETYQEVFG